MAVPPLEASVLKDPNNPTSEVPPGHGLREGWTNSKGKNRAAAGTGPQSVLRWCRRCQGSAGEVESPPVVGQGETVMFRHSRSPTCVRGLGLVLIVVAFGCRTDPTSPKQEYLQERRSIRGGEEIPRGHRAVPERPAAGSEVRGGQVQAGRGVPEGRRWRRLRSASTSVPPTCFLTTSEPAGESRHLPPSGEAIRGRQEARGNGAGQGPEERAGADHPRQTPWPD